MTEPDRWFTKSAEVYDQIYEQVVDYDHEADIVDQLARERLATATTLNEFACGTGQFLKRLAPRYQLVGSDISEEMVAVARAKVPDVDVRTGDMRTIDWGRRFDVALCLFSSIGYVEDTETAIANMARHLEPGGVLIVDGWLHPEAAIDRFLSGDVYPADDRVVARTSSSRVHDDRMIMTMGHLVTTRDGSSFFEERHEMWLRSDAEYVAAFESSGMEAVSIVPSPWPNRSRFIGTRSDG